MDKVLVHRGFSTLNIITMAFIIVIIFEVILTGARTYIFIRQVTDVELGAKLFRHLLALPVSYFENRRVGETITSKGIRTN
ncbi:ABC transporter transmembrane domain-containing protein [Escherichia coli]